MASKARVAMIGDGNVGSALAEGLRRVGYDVKTTGKQPEIVKDLAAWAEIIVLAVPFDERKNAIKEMGNRVKGKTIVDVTNALTRDLEWALDGDDVGAQQVQKWAKHATVVKAFNTVSAPNMATGQFKGNPITLFVAGDDEDAKQRVVEMGTDLGFDPINSGPLKNAGWLEAMGYFKVLLAFKLGQGMTEYRVVTEKSAIDAPTAATANEGIQTSG